MITRVQLSTRGGGCVLLKLLKDMLLPPEQSVLAQMLIQMCSHAGKLQDLDKLARYFMHPGGYLLELLMELGQSVNQKTRQLSTENRLSGRRSSFDAF